jgi:P27 family predicted phage terminase small subunit
MARGRKPERIGGDGTAEVLDPPEWLNDDAAAEWRRVAPELATRRTLTDADLWALETYCLQVAQARQMQRQIDALNDPFVYSEGGTPRPHPAFRAQRDAMTVARQFAGELGLTPAARVRVRGETPKGGNDEDGWSGLVDG